MKKTHKYLKETKEDKQFRQMLISMLACGFLFMFCLVGTTWALFETTFTTVENTLSIGEMKIEVISTKGGTSIKNEVVPSDPNTYMLREVGTYTIVLHNTGNIPGYCAITLTDAHGESESFTTGTLNPMGYNTTDTATISLEITPEDNFNGVLPISLHIEAHWGSDPTRDIQQIEEDLFVPETEPTEPTAHKETEPTAPTAPSEEASEPTEPENTVPSTPTEPSGTTPSTPPDSSEPTEPEGSEPTEPEDKEPDPTQGSENTQPSDPAEPSNPTDPTGGVAPASEEATDPSEPSGETENNE